MAKTNFRILFKRGFIFIFLVLMVYFISSVFPWILELSSVSWNLASL